VVCRNKPSVRAFYVAPGWEGQDHSVGILGQGELLSTACPSRTSLPWSVAAENQSYVTDRRGDPVLKNQIEGVDANELFAAYKTGGREGLDQYTSEQYNGLSVTRIL